jgi:hypothetical protein
MHKTLADILNLKEFKLNARRPLRYWASRDPLGASK